MYFGSTLTEIPNHAGTEVEAELEKSHFYCTWPLVITEETESPFGTP